MPYLFVPRSLRARLFAGVFFGSVFFGVAARRRTGFEGCASGAGALPRAMSSKAVSIVSSLEAISVCPSVSDRTASSS